MFGRASRQTAVSSAPLVSDPMNGSSREPPPAAEVQKATRPSNVEQSRIAQTFAQIVAVLMRDPGYRNLKIADLEWLVIPAVTSGQFRIAHATIQPKEGEVQQGSAFIPIAVALWARVSPEVDKVLSENLDKRVQLRPNQWTSGDNTWLMAAAGHPRAVPEFLKQLSEKEFKGKQVKMRLRGSDGKTVVKHIGGPA